MRLVLFVLFSSVFPFLSMAQHVRETTSRLSPALRSIQTNSFKNDSAVITFSLSNKNAFQSWKNNARILSVYAPANVIRARLSKGQLQQLQKDPSLLFADINRKPKEEFLSGTLDITLNKINLAHRLYPSLTGEGLNVSLKEQRFDVSDIDIAGRTFNSGVASESQTTHALAMACIIGGAGNAAESSTGVAKGVRLTSSSFENLLPDNDEIYAQYDIGVQNHSYGVGIENFYGSDAAAYDASTYSGNGLFHIFSSGNSGLEVSEDGQYTGINGYANLTGSFKMAKNIITVGATDSFGVVMDASSKGPAFDGRIKPEIVAFGEDGSSGAAALVSGAAVLVKQLFKQKTGNYSSAALTKAVLLNSAKNKLDKVDYSAGYGQLDVNAALNIVANDQWVERTINNSETIQIPITIPSNISLVKIMLVWSDPPAIANAGKALIDDLDAVLTSVSSGQEWKPWVLDPSPGITALQSSAIRKTDTLNNTEQITLQNPAAGNYFLSVSSDKIQSHSQMVAVAYSFDTLDHFAWTFPTVNDKPESGKPNMIRWETNISGPASVEYSLNDGSWMPVATTNINDQYTYWTVPDTFAKAKLRMIIPSLNLDSESEQFIISPPTPLQVGFNCTDSTLYYFHAQAGVTYQVYELGEKYLEPAFTTTDSFFVISKQQHSSNFFAVAPQVSGTTGLRSYAVDYNSQGVECYFSGFFASLQDLDMASLEVSLGSLFQVKELSFQKLTALGYQTIHTVTQPSEINSVYLDNQLVRGNNTYRTELLLQNGSRIYSSVETVLYFPGEPVLGYPNPVRSGQPYTIITNQPGEFTISVMNINGKLVQQSLLNDTNKSISTANLTSGIYLVRFTSSSGKSFCKKLIVY